LALLLFCSTHAQAVERPYIISGFDDVLRQAENTGLIKAALKILEEDKTFTGMSKLYQVISQEESAPRFVLVSAISHWFDGRIADFLGKTHYPAHERYLRNWLTQWSIGNFKIDRIKDIIAARPEHKFIVIFDNSDASLEMATTLKTTFPDKILAVYLRRVVEKKSPPEAQDFFTAFDIALLEQIQGRLSFEDVYQVAQTILQESERAMLFPDYALCPKDYNPCESTTKESLELCFKVQTHIQGLCRSAQ
jgi:phosphatidate phosphatase APP1